GGSALHSLHSGNLADMSDRKRELPQGSGSRVGANGTALAARRQDAGRLRVEEGRTYREIGDELVCSEATAVRYVQRILAERAPTDAEVEAYRAHLIAQSSARLALWAERADKLHADAERQADTRYGEKGESTNDLKPRLYASAVAAERTAISWAERLAKWT